MFKSHHWTYISIYPSPRSLTLKRLYRMFCMKCIKHSSEYILPKCRKNKILNYCDAVIWYHKNEIQYFGHYIRHAISIFPALISTIVSKIINSIPFFPKLLCLCQFFHTNIAGKLPFQNNIDCIGAYNTHWIFEIETQTIKFVLYYGRQNNVKCMSVLVYVLGVHSVRLFGVVQSFSECCRIRSLKLNLVTNFTKYKIEKK